MSFVPAIRDCLKKLASDSKPIQAVFFKTGPGDYAEHDQFMGLRTPLLRTCARQFQHIPLKDVEELLRSPINEERLLSLMMLVERYPQDTRNIYNSYCQHIQHVNNWNLVDVSAHHIVGAYAWQQQNYEILDQLVASASMWERRIAMVATWYTIRARESQWTVRIATKLLHDKHDLIHKAVGWMLREMGKQNLPVLLCFLDQNAGTMPRTMLRYAIERFTPEQREYYLTISTSSTSKTKSAKGGMSAPAPREP